MIGQLTQLADKWLAQARQGYINASRLQENHDDRPTGKELLEHGANCEIHCALQLKEILSSLSVSSLKTPKKTRSKGMNRS